ncbi:hypothetical protein CPB97_000141 [Podila verticillata]|nr:hypothetical protein CPB97_000141 [Podila verticillata]
MTHLSDTSYLQRAVSNSWLYGWFLIYIYKWDRFEALRWRRLVRFELRSIVTVMTMVAVALQLVYDIGSARLKYLEGFWQDPKTKEIISKPTQLWTLDDTSHVEPLYYTFACALALESSVFFLLMAFWSYISKSVTKTSFMSSLEFKINIVASVLVIVLFPTVQFIFRNDHAYKEAVPQLMFSTLMLILGGLGIRNQIKLGVLLTSAKEMMNDTTANVVFKLEYFKDMNLVLTISFFCGGIPLAITSVDGLLANPIIAVNKFASDLLITNLNFFEFVIWVTLTLIFYPRRTTSTSAPFGSSNVSVTAPTNRRIDPSLRKPSCEADHRAVDVIHYSAPGTDLEQQGGEKFNLDWSNETLPTVDPPTNNRSHTPLNSPVSETHNRSTAVENPKNLESRTLYYHEALKKALKRNKQADNDLTYDSGSNNSSGTIRFEEPAPVPPLIPRSRSGNKPGNRYPQATQPQRSLSAASQRSQHPLIEAITNDYQQAQEHGHQKMPSVDYQPKTEYRPTSPSRAHYNDLPSLTGPFTTELNTITHPSASGQDHSSSSQGSSRPTWTDSDIIRIVYDPPQSDYNPTSFYENIGREAQAFHPRPYSPRG